MDGDGATLPIIGKVADGWSIHRFADLLDGGTRNGVYKSKEFHGRGVKIVNMGELFAHPRLADVPMKRVELTADELKKSALCVGDLLFARRSLIAEGAGKCSVVCAVNEPTTFESSIIRARPNATKADSLFLYYLFSSPYGAHVLDTIRRQVAVAGITGTDLIELPIPVPPLAEQKAIAAVLGALMTRSS
jgi:type I restriction enzyme, S subunit